MTDKNEILKLARGIAGLRSYSGETVRARYINSAGEALTPETRIMLINDKHRDLIVKALIAYAGNRTGHE